jgi:hypothetical protein
VVGLGGLLLALSEGGSLGWTSPAVLAGAGAFVVLIPLFVLVEFRGRDPVIDPRLFTNRSFTMANSAAFINVLASSGVALIVALYFQAVRGETPLSATGSPTASCSRFPWPACSRAWRASAFTGTRARRWETGRSRPPSQGTRADRREIGHVRWESKPKSFGIILMLIPNESGRLPQPQPLSPGEG